jgi:hypothetical protein
MAAKNGTGRVRAAAKSAGSSPYVQRLIDDEELRASLLAAYGLARGAYGRLNNGKPATQALFEDRKLQKELQGAAAALRDASSALREPPKSARRRGGLRRTLLLGLVAGLLAVVLNEGLRTKVFDALFGSEEEFDYSSNGASAPPESAPVSAAA